MAGDTAKPKLISIVDLLQRHGVDFIVIGGQAATLHGSPLPTYDVDLCYARTALNLDRLAAALQEIHPSLRGAPPDLPFRLDAQSLALGANFTFETDLGPLDLLGWVEPLGCVTCRIGTNRSRRRPCHHNRSRRPDQGQASYQPQQGPSCARTTRSAETAPRRQLGPSH